MKNDNVKLKIFKFLFLFFIFYFLFFHSFVFAQELNNKFGIHLAQPHLEDLKKAADLVNSNGGDWGYVTLVIQENDRDKKKWQEIFNLLRRYHLIPIVRLATIPENENWRRPEISDISSWVEFLDSLNWVVKNRYIVLFNEPNHGTEWGGQADPKSYAEVAFAFAKALKEKNSNFFVMLAGFDASAPHLPPKFYDEEIFLKEMLAVARDLAHNNNTQKDSDQEQRSSDNNIGVNCPKIQLIHRFFSSNLYPRIKKNIAKTISYVNIQRLLKLFKEEKLGAITTAANQPAERLTENSDKIRKSAFFDFFENLIIENILAQERKGSLFNYIDGWASHSYPNPSFSGSPYDFGRGTIRTYQWELELLRRLGVEKDLPVFITETGWEKNKVGEEISAQNFKVAFEQVWLTDERVKAVTPFVLDYQMEPFLGFSWKKQGEEDFYQQYYLIQSIPKIKGEPEQIEKGEIVFDLPKELVSQSIYYFSLTLKNHGQGFWDEKAGYDLKIKSTDKTIDPGQFFFETINNINPFDQTMINFSLKTPKQIGQKTVFFVLEKEGREIIKSKELTLKILPLPSLKIKANLFPKINDQGDDFEIQIFDKRESLIFAKKGVDIYGGIGQVEEIKNIVFGQRYRMVILKKYYLPRQSFVVFKIGNYQVSFKPMIPLDFDVDGRFSFFDLISLVKNPRLIKFFLP